MLRHVLVLLFIAQLHGQVILHIRNHGNNAGCADFDFQHETSVELFSKAIQCASSSTYGECSSGYKIRHCSDDSIIFEQGSNCVRNYLSRYQRYICDSDYNSYINAHLDGVVDYILTETYSSSACNSSKISQTVIVDRGSEECFPPLQEIHDCDNVTYHKELSCDALCDVCYGSIEDIPAWECLAGSPGEYKYTSCYALPIPETTEETMETMETTFESAIETTLITNVDTSEETWEITTETSVESQDITTERAQTISEIAESTTESSDSETTESSDFESDFSEEVSNTEEIDQSCSEALSLASLFTLGFLSI